ncbi:MAG: hypothetical protein WCA06_17555, partial [Terrimicrobiaceae bacterium]
MPEVAGEQDQMVGRGLGLLAPAGDEASREGMPEIIEPHDRAIATGHNIGGKFAEHLLDPTWHQWPSPSSHEKAV